jgi:hypothetical protein
MIRKNIVLEEGHFYVDGYTVIREIVKNDNNNSQYPWKDKFSGKCYSITGRNDSSLRHTEYGDGYLSDDLMYELII